VEMTHWGLDSLEELKEAERSEPIPEQLIVEDIHSLVYSDVLDFSFLNSVGVDGNPLGVAKH
jgi:hypothetical protein